MDTRLAKYLRSMYHVEMSASTDKLEQSKVFVGVAWPYANGGLHAGHLAGAYIPADIFARYSRSCGNHVLFVSGSDCHGTPITLRAEEENLTPREIAERFHKDFLGYWDKLGISFDLYTTTMTDNHRRVVQDEFLKLLDHGLLFEKAVTSLYDVVAERFLPDRYIIGTCPFCGDTEARGDQCDNCGRPLDPESIINPRSRVTGGRAELRPTSHFYLDLPKLHDRLSQWVAEKKHWRRHVAGETQKFLREGLQARAITRDLDWGVPIPLEGYEDRRIYVWFEAVTGYLSASIEWAQLQGDEEAWKSWWYPEDVRQYYFLGKDNIPFHTIIWPAILMGRQDVTQLPYDVPANGFLTFSGEKASKSKGVGATVEHLLEFYQPDAVRFYLTLIMPDHDDSSFDEEALQTAINSQLVGTWGNLINRTLALIAQKCNGVVPTADLAPEVVGEVRSCFEATTELMNAVELRRALRRVLSLAQFANAYLNHQEPWSESRQQSDVEKTLGNAIYLVDALRILFYPFLPFSSRELGLRLSHDETEASTPAWRVPAPSLAGREVHKGNPLFVKAL